MPRLTGRAALAVVVLSAVLAATLAGCDAQRIEKLEEGVATEAEVRAQFGEPAATFNDPDGSRTFEYPRQPEGQVNYFITIGPDGKMSALRQVLAPKYFAQVQPGMDKAELRRLLGRPARSTTYDLKGEEVWDWRWRDGQLPKQFSVTLDRDGKVLSSASMDDPRNPQDGPAR